MFNNSISIPVTEDQPEEFSGKISSRSRRKRRKSEYRGRSETCKQLTRYWPLLVLIASVFLLIFEVYRIDWKSSPKKDDVAVGDRKPDVKKPDDNLNRLDAPRCLKLLPHEELQHLDFPLTKESFVPIKNLVYMSESNEQHDTNSQNEMGTTRFNSFTGYQTLDQRAQSFKVNETVRVHCGFYSENGSFTISNGDKNYMLTCQSVVSTCAFGGGDNLYQPIGMSDASLEKVCYVAFWDEITLATQEKEGHIINKDHFIGKWRIIIVGSLLFRDQRLNGKIPKRGTNRTGRKKWQNQGGMIRSYSEHVKPQSKARNKRL